MMHFQITDIAKLRSQTPQHAGHGSMSEMMLQVVTRMQLDLETITYEKVTYKNKPKEYLCLLSKCRSYLYLFLYRLNYDWTCLQIMNIKTGF